MLRSGSLHTMSRILRCRSDIVGSSSVKGRLRPMTTKEETKTNAEPGERLMSDFWAVYGWKGAAVLGSGVSLAVWLGTFSVNHRIDALGNRIDAKSDALGNRIDALSNRIDAKMAENQNELKGILLNHQKWTADQVWKQNRTIVNIQKKQIEMAGNQNKQDEEIKKQAEILNQHVLAHSKMTNGKSEKGPENEDEK